MNRARVTTPWLEYLEHELKTYDQLCKAEERARELGGPKRACHLTFARQVKASGLRRLIESYGPEAEEIAARYHFRRGGLLQ